MALSKTEFLQKRKPRIESVNIPELGGDVFVRVPSSAQLNEFESRQSKLRTIGKSGVNFDARVAIMVCCDESGEPLFLAPDEEALSHVDALALKKILDKVSPWFGWTEASVEEAAKNSQPTQGECSSTD